MTIGYKQLGFQFRLTEVDDIGFNARTRQNVKKRIENIAYLRQPPADSVKLSYVGSDEISATNNIYIGDRSDSLYENSREGKVQEVIASDSPIYVNNRNFIATQEFKKAESGNIPLYYSHELQEDYTSIVAESIRIYDKDFNPVGEDKYEVILDQKYDEDTGAQLIPPVYTSYRIANNLKSLFNYDSGEYQVYFIQYTQVIDSIDVTITELLNNELSYKEAQWEDMWHSTNANDVKPWIRAYLLLDGLEVKFPINKDYAIKYEESKKMSVKYPSRTGSVSPWFPRITNGSFQSGSQYKYDIPEFVNQSFNPIEPYKTAVNVSCQKIDDTLIKFPNEFIKQGLLFSSVYVEVKHNGVVRYALTTDVNKDGTDYLDLDGKRVYDENDQPIQWSSSLLLGIDGLSGIANTDFTVYDYYDIRATYSYKEEHFELTSLNMNPLFDNSVSSGIRAIYIVPVSAFNFNTGQKASVKWVKVSSSGYIIASNQSGKDNNEKIDFNVNYKNNEGYGVSGVLGMHYSRRATATVDGPQEVLDNFLGGKITLDSTSTFPLKGWVRFLDTNGYYRYVQFTDKTHTELLLPDNIPYSCLIPEGTTIELVNFIDERTTLTNRKFDIESPLTPLPFPVVKSRYFVLAELSVNPPHSYKDLVEIDVREHGGGVREEKYDDAKAKQPEVQWYNDYSEYDGQVHPGNATLVIKLPATILESFTEFQIESIVEKYVPLGVKPIIRYYGYQPQIISVMPIASTTSWGFGEGPFGEYSFGGN